MDTTRCVACGRAYVHTNSRPRWAFDREGRPIGTIHSGCAERERESFLSMGWSKEDQLDDAQRDLWLFVLTKRQPAIAPANFYAPTLLSYGENDTLSDKQASLLDWWVVRRADPLGDEHRAAILAAYAELLAEYRAWKAGLEAGR